ncbi:MAG TPA: hypothetical protein VGA55_03705, partial [Bacteroidota bacterium]
FEARVTRERLNYMNKVNAHLKEQKFETRTFGILLKAIPHSYNADRGEYMVACSVQVEAPYTIPSLLTYVPSNSFLRVQDTIVGGYRTSRLTLKFSPYFRWKIERPIAMEAKSGESDLYFRIRVAIDISQPNIKDQALLKIVPREIQLTNTKKGTVYWRDEAR